MAVITSYATLQTAVSDYLEREDLATFIPNFIQNCEGKLYRDVKLRDMETALSETVSSGVISVPTRYLELKYAYVDQSPVRPLQIVPVQDVYEQYPVRSSGPPVVIAREGSNFIFGPVPADGVTIKGLYYKYYEPVRTTDPNWYITNAPHVLLYGSLIEAEPFLRNDERIQLWRSLYDEGVGLLKRESLEERRSGGYLAARVG